ncbi:MAG: hypothetical protein ACHP9V_01765 [Terriglobales bacterium]
MPRLTLWPETRQAAFLRENWCMSADQDPPQPFDQNPVMHENLKWAELPSGVKTTLVPRLEKRWDGEGSKPP